MRPQDPPYPPTFLAPGRLQSCFATKIFLVDFRTRRFFGFLCVLLDFRRISFDIKGNPLFLLDSRFPFVLLDIKGNPSKIKQKHEKNQKIDVFTGLPKIF